MKLEQTGGHFAYDIFKCDFTSENHYFHVGLNNNDNNNNNNNNNNDNDNNNNDDDNDNNNNKMIIMVVIITIIIIIMIMITIMIIMIMIIMIIMMIIIITIIMTMVTMTVNMFLLPCITYMIDTTNHIHKNSSSLLSFGTKINYNCTWQKGLEAMAYVPQYLLYKVIV